MQNGVIDIEAVKFKTSLRQFIYCYSQVSLDLCYVGNGQLKTRDRLRKDGNK